ncbi:MAG: acyltransferase [Polyangiales bacterium]
MSAVGTRERLQSLDVLRGIAIVLVLSHHLQRCPPTVSPIVRAVFDVAHLGGWIGVDLFFVLSGFLVSGLIFREHVARGSFQPARFLIRRGFKIYPAFYVLLLVTLFDLEDRINISTANLWGEVFFLQNYLGAIWNHTWSLAVEEHFYLLLSALLFAWSRRRATNPFAGLVWLTPLVMFVTLALRLASCIRGHAPYQTHWATHFRVDSLLFGVLLSWLFHYQPEALRARVAERRGALPR